MQFEFLKIDNSDKEVAYIILNRPEVHNAFNEKMIDEILDCFKQLKKQPGLRLVFIKGSGISFCAGADLNWMKSMKEYSFEQNFKDSQKLAKMFKRIDEFPLPVIGLITGHAFGGGVGLVSVCDYVLSLEEAKFAFSEVRLGLIPAVISPYVVRKIGIAKARAWFLSGERFNAKRGEILGLIDEAVNENEFENRVEEIKKSFLKAAPDTVRSCKAFINELEGLLNQNDNAADIQKNIENFTCLTIAQARIKNEGQEGMAALLEKRKPEWQQK
jgi:methylglutaconyl-CoA hydratase